jgi:hypothetical protein
MFVPRAPAAAAAAQHLGASTGKHVAAADGPMRLGIVRRVLAELVTEATTEADSDDEAAGMVTPPDEEGGEAAAGAGAAGAGGAGVGPSEVVAAVKSKLARHGTGLFGGSDCDSSSEDDDGDAFSGTRASSADTPTAAESEAAAELAAALAEEHTVLHALSNGSLSNGSLQRLSLTAL